MGSRASELVFSPLAVGLSLAPGVTALVPAVPRDAHGWHQLERAQLKVLNLRFSRTLDTKAVSFSSRLRLSFREIYVISGCCKTHLVLESSVHTDIC